MTDKKWQELLNKVTSLHSDYLVFLTKAENEYERRFGHHPSDVDDDFWIDSFHQSPAGARVEDVIKAAQR